MATVGASSDKRLRVVFAGTPEFAAELLLGLLDAGFSIQAVLTQPDRPAGRGRKTRASAVKKTALTHNLPVLQPEKIDQTTIDTLESLQTQVIAVAAYGLILPPSLLRIPSLGCINLHASLLPRWRGAAPIQRAILAGDRDTGVTVMQMDAGLDTGDILDTRSCPIHPRDTAQTLHDRLAALGRELLPHALRELSERDLPGTPQDPSLATYASRLSKTEALLDWSKSALELERKVRAFNPWPVAFSQVDNERLRIWEASTVTSSSSAAPGVITGTSRDGIEVATGDGSLRLERLQFPGARPVAAIDLINAGRLAPGTRLHG